jgi:hypothetical protein
VTRDAFGTESLTPIEISNMHKPNPDTKDAIIREMIQAMKHLGAQSDLLSIVCSLPCWCDTMLEEDVLKDLRHWNEVGHATRCTEPGGIANSTACSPGAAVCKPVRSEWHC